jgi:hypothetical protein
VNVATLIAQQLGGHAVAVHVRDEARREREPLRDASEGERLDGTKREDARQIVGTEVDTRVTDRALLPGSRRGLGLERERR